MATKITSDMLESYLHCRFKSYLKLSGQEGTKCDFEAMVAELRAEVRLKAIDTIIARNPGAIWTDHNSVGKGKEIRIRFVLHNPSGLARSFYCYAIGLRVEGALVG